MSIIDDFLRWQCRAMEDTGVQAPVWDALILRIGHERRGSRLPRGIKAGPARQCYMNAGRLVTLGHAGFRYCEGYGLAPGVPFPVPHAWCLDDQDRVIDVTWREPQDCRYLGIVFPADDAWAIWGETGYWSIMSCPSRAAREFIAKAAPDLMPFPEHEGRTAPGTIRRERHG